MAGTTICCRLPSGYITRDGRGGRKRRGRLSSFPGGGGLGARARKDGAAVCRVSGEWRRWPTDRETRAPARGRVDRGRLSRGRWRDPAIVVRSLLRTGSGRAPPGGACDHVVQPQLAEPNGSRGRRVPRKSRGGGS